MKINKNYRDKFAYDISKNVINKGEVWDENAINQSIEMILTTSFGERLFNPYFGSELPAVLFENMTNNTAERLLESIINSIKTYEDRVYLLENQCKLNADISNNSVSIMIPYVIKQNNIVSRFEKKIMFS